MPNNPSFLPLSCLTAMLFPLWCNGTAMSQCRVDFSVFHTEQSVLKSSELQYFEVCKSVFSPTEHNKDGLLEIRKQRFYLQNVCLWLI